MRERNADAMCIKKCTVDVADICEEERFLFEKGMRS
jgi:hypothetical protein